MELWPIEQQYYNKELYHIGLDLIEDLKPKQRAIIKAFLVQDKSLIDILKITRGNHDTVTTQKKVAIKNLKKRARRKLMERKSYEI